MSQCSETGRGTDSCGCCEGIARRTPSKIANAPGLPKIEYRIGRHPCFKQSMLAGLSDPGNPTLRDGLNTRADDDFAIALLDGAAVMADILTFYQERIANESYLRTATERFSVLQLARLVGYRLSPGVAASTHLAFTLEQPPALPAGTTPSSSVVPEKVTIKAGTKAQSIPGQDERVETFETGSDLIAEPQLNALRVVSQPLPARGVPGQLVATLSASAFSGFVLDQPLVLSGRASGPAGESPASSFVVPKLVTEIATAVELQLGRQYLVPPPTGGAPAGSDRALVSGEVTGLSQGDHLVVFSESSDRVEDKTLESLKAADPITEIVWKPALQQRYPADVQVHKWTRKYRLYGHNLPDEIRTTATSVEPVVPDADYLKGGWPLDGSYDELLAGQEVLICLPTRVQRARITSVGQGGVAVGRFAASVTRVALAPAVGLSISDLSQIRAAVLYQLAGPPSDGWRYHAPSIQTGAGKVWIPLCDVPKGRHVALTDGSDSPPDVVVVTACTADKKTGLTKVEFTPALTRPLDTLSAAMLGNVVEATHGETTSEVLGSGDGSQAYQVFTLRQPPLTYVGATGAGGAKSTLEVRVDDRLWAEVPTLYGRGPDEHIYVTRTENDGTTVVQFGDGKTGARLPTGRENVRARYRKGIGAGGMVKAGQISLLPARPLGAKSVVNPVAATDAADPEALESARRTAPLKVLTLDRVVSLQDYEDFAQAFAGIAKALATWTWNGERRGVFLSVAGPKGVGPSEAKCGELAAALHHWGDPYVAVTVKPCRPVGFILHASLKVQPDRAGEENRVVAAAREAIAAAFSFEARNIGQAVALSEVMAVLQAVSGVQAANVALLVRPDQVAVTQSWAFIDILTVLPSLSRLPAVSADPVAQSTRAGRVEPRLIAAFPRMGERGVVSAAELLTVQPESLTLGMMT